MNVLLLEFAINTGVGINHGVASLAAVLKEEGYSVQFRTITTCVEDAYLDVFNDPPVLIGISVMEPQMQYVTQFCRIVKLSFPLIKIVIGGPYPTMAPIICIQDENIDHVVVGDGETALLQILTDIKNKGTPYDIYYTKFEDLSKLPPEDLSIFDLQSIIMEKKNKVELSMGRGCVYSCKYCINKSFLDLYHLKAKEYVRVKPFDHILAELNQYKQHGEVKSIYFIDDDFQIYDHLLPHQKELFYQQYKEQIGLPFLANVNLNSVTEANIQTFANAGGYGMRVGIESCERLRESVLGRKMSDHQIREKAALLQKYKIQLSTYNMIGVPGETGKDIGDLFALNAELTPAYVKVMTFYPFKNTPLYQECETQNLIDHAKLQSLTNYDTETALKYPKHWQLCLKWLQQHFEVILNHKLKKLGKKGYYEKLSRSLAIYHSE